MTINSEDTGENQSNGLEVGYGRMRLRARGLALIVILSVAAIITSNLYAGFRLEQAFVRNELARLSEHRALQLGQDRLGCVVAISPEQREAFRRTYQPGAFARWCPWVQE